MSVNYIFYHNKNIKGVYDNLKLLKKDAVFYIINYLIEEKKFNNKKDACIALKNKFLSLFKEECMFFDYKNNTWLIRVLEKNKILNDNAGFYQTKFDKINVKGKEFIKRDLSKDLEYLPLTPLYNN